MNRSLATQDPFALFRRNFLNTQSAKKTANVVNVNIYDDGESFLVRTKLPGFNVDDIDIEVVKNKITMKGSRKTEDESDDFRWHRKERLIHSFERSFSLPETVNPNTVQASFKNGLLEIVLERDEAVKAKKITITKGDE